MGPVIEFYTEEGRNETWGVRGGAAVSFCPLLLGEKYTFYWGQEAAQCSSLSSRQAVTRASVCVMSREFLKKEGLKARDTLTRPFFSPRLVSWLDLNVLISKKLTGSGVLRGILLVAYTPLGLSQRKIEPRQSHRELPILPARGFKIRSTVCRNKCVLYGVSLFLTRPRVCLWDEAGVAELMLKFKGQQISPAD